MTVFIQKSLFRNNESGLVIKILKTKKAASESVHKKRFRDVIVV